MLLNIKNNHLKILAIYFLSQIPILLIYHVHLSLGGMADRLYWIVFGYIMLNQYDEYHKSDSHTLS